MTKDEKEFLPAFYALFGNDILEQAKVLLEDSTFDVDKENA